MDAFHVNVKRFCTTLETARPVGLEGGVLSSAFDVDPCQVPAEAGLWPTATWASKSSSVRMVTTATPTTARREDSRRSGCSIASRIQVEGAPEQRRRVG